MAYTPPTADAVNFSLSSGYSAPLGGEVDFALGDPEGLAGATPSPLPGIIAPCGMHYRSRRDRRLGSGSALRYIAPPPQDRIVATPWGRHDHQDNTLTARWGMLLARNTRTLSRWTLGTRTDPGATRSTWRMVPAKDRGTLTPWGHGIAQDQGGAQRWRHLTKPTRRDQAHDQGRALPWRSSDIFRLKGSNELVPYSVPATGEPVNFALTATDYTPPAVGEPVNFSLSIWEAALQDLPISPRDRGDHTRYRQLSTLANRHQSRDPDTLIRWGPGGPGWIRDSLPIITPWPTEPNPPPTTVILPIRSVYIVIHNISLTRLDDGYEIDAERLTCNYNADAWGWQFSATLRGKNALDAIMPDINGQPVTLVATINGYTWHLIVEDWTEDREFAKRGVSVTGRGLSAQLDSPYQLPGSGVTGAALTIQQLMADHLPLGSGWTLAFASGTPDWLVPAGAWSWSNQTPIAAIHAAAQGTGLVVVPSMAAQTLTVQPRYPVLPWDYAGATPDLVVPEAAIMRLQRRQAVATQANAVYVHGGEVGGVLCRVLRNLSAGDRVAPTQTSSLITDADAGRLLGGRILSGQHQQPGVRGITLPLGGEFPLGAVGNLLRIDLPGDTQHGIINAVSIEASRSDRGDTARQTLQIGEETPNTWAKFKRLLPGDPLLSGTVDTAHADGTVTVLLTAGGYVRVRGDAQPGDNVYLRSGRIDGPAPAMAQLEITV
ncbi:hypothetical protein [Sedimenticola hydrogenitrophicus]|uniref:hypothetical protein n=1 Tax=Sedimenticola hydrogenitrophicus TaxID=2967975 RepID=UPI0023AEA662|nr:hypothetical protein [Sedimenticola hydrogenitrophicus]